MLTHQTLIEFFAWSSVINIVLLIITGLAITLLRAPLSKIHHRFSGVEESELYKSYFNYIAFYKILVIVFNIVPYLALKIIY